MELKPQIGKVILADLRKIADIPTKGILAGGAVADWFMDLAPRDIDIFVPCSAIEHAHRKMGVTTANFGMPEVMIDRYESTQNRSIAWKKHYQVVASESVGLINTIKCFGENLTASRIINGFDLNCTKVAIDLETESLLWDEEFTYFLKNKKLKVSALFTPVHTAIRFFLKKHRYQCVGSDDIEMEIISESWSNNRMGRGDYQLPEAFGKGYLEKAQAASDLGLKKYFRIEPLDRFWTLKPRRNPVFETGLLTGVLFPVIGPKVLRAQRTSSQIYQKKIKDLEYLGSSVFAKTMLDIQGVSWVRGKVSEAALSDVEKFVTDRPYISPIFFSLHLERQFQVKRRIERFCERRGSWVLGLIEEQATYLDVISDHSIEDFMDKFEGFYCKNFKELDNRAPKNVLWYKIEELISSKSNFQERELMGHELGRSSEYPKMVFSVQSRFFNKYRSTVEVSDYFNGHYGIENHKPFRGRELSILHQCVALWIIVSLNADNSTRQKLVLLFQYFKDQDLAYRIKNRIFKSIKSWFGSSPVAQR